MSPLESTSYDSQFFLTSGVSEEVWEDRQKEEKRTKIRRKKNERRKNLILTSLLTTRGHHETM